MKCDISKMRHAHEAYSEYQSKLIHEIFYGTDECTEEALAECNAAWNALTPDEKDLSLFFDAQNLW